VLQLDEYLVKSMAWSIGQSMLAGEDG
jgi:hypothetical protein